MAAELKSKVVRGFAWNSAEKIASALVTFYVAIKVVNRVSPGEYGVFAILVAFVAVFNTFVDSGFSQALIREKEPTQGDFSSAFWFNIAVSVVIYGLLVGLSYPAAALFEMPELINLAPVMYLVVPLGALCIIQNAVLTRSFDFRRISSITFASVVGAGVVAVVLAVKGCGVWALVGQRVTQIGLKAVLLWFFGRWKPSARFSGASIRSMSRFSSRILATDLINNLYGKIPQFAIGGRVDEATLGYYDNASKLRDLPVSSTLSAMQAVTFPALAKLRDDDRKFADGVGKVVSSIVFIMFPMMAGLIVVAADFFGLFLNADWQGSVPFFQILALTGMMTPVTIVSYNIMKTRSDGGALVKAEIIKKVFATAIFAATIPFGAIPIAWGMVGIAFTDMVVSFSTGRRYCDYGVGRLARDVFPVLALTAVMAGAVWGLGFLMGAWPLWLALAVKIAAGVVIYLGGAALLRLDGFREFTEVLRKLFRK